MVADNCEDPRHLLQPWPERKGCRVVEAVNGREAVEFNHGERPDPDERGGEDNITLILARLDGPGLPALEPDADRRIKVEHR